MGGRRGVAFALVCAALISVLVMASVPASALSTTIPAGGSFTYKVLAVKGDNITFSWDASQSLAFHLRGPDGVVGGVLFSTGGDQVSRSVKVYVTGEYELQWFNGRESSVRMSFDASSSTIDSIRDPLVTDRTLLSAILVTLVIFILVVIVLMARSLGPPSA